MTRMNMLGLLAITFAVAACQQTPQMANANLNANVNANASTTPTPEAVRTVEAREPETYAATLILMGQTAGGEQVIGVPTLTAEVARSGDSRRYSFRLPNGEQVVYLERGAERYLIFPSRRQYAEISREAVGFEVPRIMTPGEIVAQLRAQSGYERVGEEQMNGRTVIKYRYATTVRTGTEAGTAQTENFVYVDKETGLPLRSELRSETEREVQGIKSLRLVAEMRDIRTDVNPSLFEVPQDFNRVTTEQVRQQIDALASLFTTVLQNMMQRPTAQPSPTVTPSPTAR